MSFATCASCRVASAVLEVAAPIVGGVVSTRRGDGSVLVAHVETAEGERLVHRLLGQRSPCRSEPLTDSERLAGAISTGAVVVEPIRGGMRVRVPVRSGAHTSTTVDHALHVGATCNAVEGTPSVLHVLIDGIGTRVMTVDVDTGALEAQVELPEIALGRPVALGDSSVVADSRPFVGPLRVTHIELDSGEVTTWPAADARAYRLGVVASSADDGSLWLQSGRSILRAASWRDLMRNEVTVQSASGIVRPIGWGERGPLLAEGRRIGDVLCIPGADGLRRIDVPPSRLLAAAAAGTSIDVLASTPAEPLVALRYDLTRDRWEPSDAEAPARVRLSEKPHDVIVLSPDRCAGAAAYVHGGPFEIVDAGYHPLASVLVGLGFETACPNYPGSGPTPAVRRGRDDVDAVVRCVDGHARGGIVVGHCYGATLALIAAAAGRLDARVCVALSPFLSVRSLRTCTSDHNIRALIDNTLLTAAGDLDLHAVTPGQIALRIVVVAHDGDETIPLEETRRAVILLQERGFDVSFHVLHGSDHAFRRSTTRRQLADILTYEGAGTLCPA